MEFVEKPDAGKPVAGEPEVVKPDARMLDARTSNPGSTDTGTLDAGIPDARAPLDEESSDSGEPKAMLPQLSKVEELRPPLPTLDHLMGGLTLSCRAPRIGTAKGGPGFHQQTHERRPQLQRKLRAHNGGSEGCQ